MVIDILLLVFLIGGFLWGFNRGLIHSFFAFVGLFLGIMLALKFSHLFSIYLQQWLSVNTKFLPIISFTALFVIVILVVRILSKLLEKVVSTLYLGFVNKVIGGFLWCIILTIIFSTLLWMLNQVNLITPEMKTDSQTYEAIISLAPRTIDFCSQVVPFFQGLFDSLDQMFEQLSAPSEPIQA